MHSSPHAGAILSQEKEQSFDIQYAGALRTSYSGIKGHTMGGTPWIGNVPEQVDLLGLEMFWDWSYSCIIFVISKVRNGDRLAVAQW